MVFGDETIDVMIAGYLSREAAYDDFESVRRSGGYVHAAMVISKDLEGNVSAEQTDHVVRGSTRSVAKVGFVMGLFVPPLLLVSTAAGAAAGAGVGMLLHRLTEHELKQRAGATIPIGGAGLVVAYPKSSADIVRPAVKRAISTAIGEADGNRLTALTGALAEAQRKVATAGA